MSTVALDPAEVLKRAHAVGRYYGFESFSSAAAKARGNPKPAMQDALSLDSFDPSAREVVGFLKRVRDAGLSPQPGRPLFLWHTNAAPGRTSPKQIIIQFHAIGADRAIADAVLIRAVRSLAADLGKVDVSLRINSMGDKETRARYSRELTHFFRKRAGVLPQDCSDKAKDDLLGAAEMLSSRGEHEGLPCATDHLSETSRKHFESVLEYLEATDTPYELTPHLLSRGGAWNDTCFHISAGDRIDAWGSRYVDLAKHFFKGAASSIGAVIRIATEAKTNIAPIKEKGRPRFVFVHIGDEAKRESMKMADHLRKARIPLTQVLGVESLSEQMRYADIMNPPYLLIMGRKEALERSVILRERETHSESQIPLDTLIDRLRAVA
jgi:histidyl-tRNA synthetase